MAIKINPFHDLYVGESIDPDKFVSLFSDVIVEHALALFQPGHVILKGLPGAGKSMLLNLLKPSVRLAYHKSGEKFPVPLELRKFIGAGINLKRSGVSDFGQRPIDPARNLETSPIFFGDFLNYWVVSDILLSIKKLACDDVTGELGKEIGIKFDSQKNDAFANELAKLDCWYGYMKDVTNFQQLQDSINSRITSYRAFLNYNIEDLSEEIRNTKSMIGIPISKCVELLKEHNIINKDVQVYIRIDQFEELAWLDESIATLGNSYQEVIYKLLGMRDSNVSYRIGARHFAWSNTKKMFGTTARLEKNRNYNEVSIDTVLKRKENSRLWVFPKFAEDIFFRRMKLSPYNYDHIQKNESLMSYVFGNGFPPAERALTYVPNDGEKAIRIEDNWPQQWVLFLKKLAKTDPLSARLGEAWARQKGKEKIMEELSLQPPYPWEDRTWWRKERIEQALMQIASRNQQGLLYYGKGDILALSGGYILIFLSLCQHIWDVWLRDKRNDSQSNDMSIPIIDSVIQSAGIRETSSDWYDDIANEKGGKERKLLISYLGALFYKKLVEDKAMSYPGNNGFSLTIEDWEKNSKIFQFINAATDYGDLYDAPHTGKTKTKTSRHKWYLNPILSPYFRIPYSHTKEPIYADIDMVATWLIESKAFDPKELDWQIDSTKSGTKRKGKGNNGNQSIIGF